MITFSNPIFSWDFPAKETFPAGTKAPTANKDAKKTNNPVNISLVN
jgi:hypothetical protein